MTTPKELADKARKLASDMQCRARDASKTTTVDTLCATIDQLQAMAEARQATCRDDGRCQYAIDHGAEGMGHCPPGKCAMPPSAQQATGTSDPIIRALRMADMALASWENGYAFNSHGPSREAQRLVTTALAAATQAQPEADREALADVTRQTLAELCEAREWHPKYRAKYLAVLAGIDTLAAPTTGKREPLTASDSQFLTDVLTASGLVSHGRQDKALGARLGEAVTRIRSSHAAAIDATKRGEG